MAAGLVKRGRYWRAYAKIAGRVRWHPTGLERLSDARKARDVWLTELRQRLQQPNGPARTFEQFAAVYRDRHAKHQRSYKASTSYIIDGLVAGLAGQRLVSIRAATIEQMRDDLRKRELSTATRNRWVANLMSMLNKAHQWGYIAADQLADVRRVKLEREDNARLRVLTQAEESRLLAECTDTIRPLIVAALHTGCRVGELFKLRWTDVSIDGRSLHVRPENAKSKRGRDIPLDATMVALLGSLPRLSQWVFPGRGGKRQRVTMAKQFVHAAREAKLEDVCIHTLRHTFCSRLAMAGAMERDLCDLLGWTSSRMAARYTHLARPHLRALVERIDTSPAKKVTKTGYQGRKKARLE